MVAERIVLDNGNARLELVPALGGGIARLDVRHPNGALFPVLRPWNGRMEDGPFALGCNVLVPFSNRISGGGFEHDGAFHPVPANLRGEPLPIHGTAFSGVGARLPSAQSSSNSNATGRSVHSAIGHGKSSGSRWAN